MHSPCSSNLQTIKVWNSVRLCCIKDSCNSSVRSGIVVQKMKVWTDRGMKIWYNVFDNMLPLLFCIHVFLANVKASAASKPYATPIHYSPSSVWVDLLNEALISGYCWQGPYS